MKPNARAHNLKATLLVILVSTALLSSFEKANQALSNRTMRTRNRGGGGSVLLGGNVTQHDGDIIVDGIETYLIENCTFIQNGSIRVKDHATLLVRNSNLTIVQSFPYQHSVTVQYMATMIAEGALITSNYDLTLYSRDASTIEITGSEIQSPVRSESIDESDTTIKNSIVDAVEGGGYAQIFIEDSRIHELKSCCPFAPTFSASNSTITRIWASDNSVMHIVDSNVGEISGDYEAHIRLLSSTVNSTMLFDQATLHVLWRLIVAIIDSDGSPVQGATVDASYKHDGSLVESNTTGLDGKVRFVLFEKIANSTEAGHVGNYTIEASWEKLRGKKDVELTRDEELTIRLFGPIEIAEVIYSPAKPLEDQNVTVTASIDGTGISNVTLECSMDNGSSWQTMTMQLQNNNIYMVTVPKQKANVTVQFYVVAYDDAGHGGESDLYNYTVTGITWPTVEITSPTTHQIIKSDTLNVTWRISAGTREISNVEIRLDEENWINVTDKISHIFANLSEGIHEISIRATNNVGNEAEGAIVVTIELPKPFWYQHGQLFASVLVIIGVLAFCAYLLVRRRKAQARLGRYLHGGLDFVTVARMLIVRLQRNPNTRGADISNSGI